MMGGTQLHLLFGLCCVLAVELACGHVRLTFPQARYPHLDFLDNYRSSKPCGVSKPEEGMGVHTTLLAGSTVNITWSMAYPHKGGFRLELLNSNDHPVKVLTPNSRRYTGLNDQTVQYYEVTLPSKECRNCGIRLVREAKEWGKYIFWSCADINIVKKPSNLLCNFHGTYSEGKCSCDHLYSGKYCQNKDECESNSDCGDNGECQEFKSVTYPKRVCYCKLGYSGESCATVSPMKENRFEASLYNAKELNEDKDMMYWRVIEETNELEVVAQFKSKSWVAIGWKPTNIDETCGSLDALSSLVKSTEGGSAEPEVSAESEPESEAEAEPEAESEPESTSEEAKTEDSSSVSEPEAEAESQATTQPETEAESSADSESETSSDTESATAEETTQIPHSTLDAGFVTYELQLGTETPVTEEYGADEFTTQVRAGGNNIADSETYPEVVGDACYGDWRWPAGCRDCDYRISWTYVDETDEMEFSVETKAPSNWWTGVGFSKMGSMEDADMVIVKSKRGRMTLHDMHSNGYNSAPSEDTQQDVYTPTVVGTHINGVMRATFTRLRDTADVKGDAVFTDNDCFYFLFPVTGGRLNDDESIQKHIVSPKVSKKKICISSCVSEGQTLAPSAPHECQTEFRYPTGCEGTSCDYVAKWIFYDTEETVQFEVTARELGRWTGIGFSRDGNMTNSDIYTGWVYDDKAYISDRFAYSRQLPAIDPSQDLIDVGGKIEDDFQTIWFTRKAVTSDTVTDYSLDDCYYFLFPVGGGRVLARSEEDFKDAATPIGFHDLYQPKVSREKICVCTEFGRSVKEAVRRKRESSVGEPEPEPEAESKAKSKLHPMDCTDLVIASAVGTLSRVKDYYTVSRATPMLDEVYGGEQSITSAMAYEDKDVTTVMFRKKLIADDSADHSISYDGMEVIWAKGQEHGSYSHEPKSVLETSKAKNKDYYETDVLMYHGNKNRGHFTVNFYDKPNNEIAYCAGAYAYPPSCVGDLCTYNLTWYRDSSGVHFVLETKMDAGHWTGVGFSRDGLMSEADMIIAIVKESGVVEITDRYSEGYGRPSVDESQNIFSVEGIYSSGRLRAKFSRAMTTADQAEHDADFQTCQYFLYPHSGGQMRAEDTVMWKHQDTPIQSSSQICLAKCTSGSGSVEDTNSVVVSESDSESVPEGAYPEEGDENSVNVAGSSISGPVSRQFLVTLHIMNENWDDSLSSPHSDRYKDLSTRVLSAVDSLLSSRFTGYQHSRVLSYSSGSVFVTVEVTATGVSESDIINVILPAISAGQVEGLDFDSQKLFVSPVSNSLTPEEIRNWIIIGIACLLVVVAIIFAICMVVRTRKNKSQSLNGYAGTYPGAYQYPPGTGTLPEKTKSFDNQAYHPEYSTARRQQQQHNRQFSNATTASPNGKTPSPKSTEEDPKGPNGTGETTYQEWYSKVATHPASQSHQEAADRTPQTGRAQAVPLRAMPGTTGRPMYRPGAPGPYVSYPNDPYNYYTLNGQSRFGNQMQQPGYYRQY